MQKLIIIIVLLNFVYSGVNANSKIFIQDIRTTSQGQNHAEEVKTSLKVVFFDETKTRIYDNQDIQKFIKDVELVNALGIENINTSDKFLQVRKKPRV